jgi:alkylation response protein AidB-like acyl-CoA dehydrogenase
MRDPVAPFAAGDWFTADEHLRWLARCTLGDSLWPVAHGALEQAGRLVPDRVEPLARRADANRPHLPEDRAPACVDDLAPDPACRELERLAHEFGLVRMSYQKGWRSLPRRAPRALSASLLYLFAQADQTVCGGPLLMTDALCRTLERHDPSLGAGFLTALAADTDDYLSGTLLAAEGGGDPDPGVAPALAVPEGDGTWRLHCEGLRCPNVLADVALVPARAEGSPPGIRGLGLFLMARRLDGGGPNRYRVDRLHDGLGARAVLAGDVRLEGAVAWPVGRIDRGFRQLMDLATLTRTLLTAIAAASMQRSARDALEHARSRTAFGRSVDAHPLLRDALAELVVDATAGVTAALEVASLLDRADHGRAGADGLLRLVTPLFKLHAGHRARVCALGSLEIQGASAAGLEWEQTRALRDTLDGGHVDGPSTLVALDVLRAADQGAAPALFAELEARLRTIGGISAPLAPPLLTELMGQRGELDELALLDDEVHQLRAGTVARRLALLTISCHLAEQAQAFAEDSGSGRLAWLAARFAARLGGERAVATVAGDPAWLPHAPALLQGGPVPLEVGAEAVQAAAGALKRSAP